MKDQHQYHLFKKMKTTCITRVVYDISQTSDTLPTSSEEVKDLIAKSYNFSFTAEYKEYDEDGQIRLHKNYKNGEMVGQQKIWSKDGQIIFHRNYDCCGRENGEQKEWDDNANYLK